MQKVPTENCRKFLIFFIVLYSESFGIYRSRFFLGGKITVTGVVFVWLLDSNISEVELGALVDASTGSLGCLNVSYAC